MRTFLLLLAMTGAAPAQKREARLQKKTNRDAFSDAVTLFFEENLLK
jgi:hypothetical protein